MFSMYNQCDLLFIIYHSIKDKYKRYISQIAILVKLFTYFLNFPETP